MHILIAGLRGLHLLTLLYAVFGWLWPTPGGLFFYIVAIPFLVMHWVLNNGSCYLTDLEYKLQGKEIDNQKTEQKGGFTKLLFGKLLGYVPPNWALFLIVYGVLLLGWSLGIYNYVRML